MQTLNYNRPVRFFILATLFPWAFWFMAAYISHSSIICRENLSACLAFAGLVSPVLIVLFLLRKNRELIKDIKGRILLNKTINPKFVVIGFGLMLVSILAAQAVSLIFGYSITQFKFAGHFSFSSGLFPVWAILIIAPLLEELAWHSYGTDSLRSRFNLFTTSVVFALFWGIWHFPLSFINGYYHSNLVEEGFIYSLNFVISLFPFVIIMNWIYYKTNRNILITIIFHISAGLFNEIFQTHPMSKVIQTGLLLIFSIYLLIKENEFFFKKAL